MVSFNTVKWIPNCCIHICLEFHISTPNFIELLPECEHLSVTLLQWKTNSYPKEQKKNGFILLCEDSALAAEDGERLLFYIC